MDELMFYLKSTPLAMILVGAHFVVYSAVAWLIVFVRALAGRFSRKEWLVLGLFVLALALEAFQLLADGSRFLSRRSTWGLPRYFGVYAPILWLWAAKVLGDLWSVSARPLPRFLCRLGIVAALLWVVGQVLVLDFRRLYRTSGAHDVQVAAERIAPIIRADYAGPRRQAEVRRRRGEYFTANRPVVFSDMAAAAWTVRGQSEGPLMKGFPYLDDYLFVRVGSGYGKIETVDARQYDYVCDVSGEGTVWRLFRRKGVPHTDKLKEQSKENEL